MSFFLQSQEVYFSVSKALDVDSWDAKVNNYFVGKAIVSHGSISLNPMSEYGKTSSDSIRIFLNSKLYKEKILEVKIGDIFHLDGSNYVISRIDARDVLPSLKYGIRLEAQRRV